MTGGNIGRGQSNLARYKHTFIDENYLRVWPNVCWCPRPKYGSLFCSLNLIRFRMREAVESDPHGRRKIHSNARLRGQTKSVSNCGGTVKSLPLSGFPLRITPSTPRYETVANLPSGCNMVSASTLFRWNENTRKWISSFPLQLNPLFE